MIPWMHKNSIKHIEEYCKNSDNVVLAEFGSGNSTIYYETKASYVYSVEHNTQWYNKIKPQLTNNNTNYTLKEQNYVSKQPIDNKFYGVNDIHEIWSDISNIDIVIIDGINRVNCFYGVVEMVKLGGLIILDDCNRIYKPASDGSYMPIKEYCEKNDYEEHEYRGADRNTCVWIKK